MDRSIAVIHLYKSYKWPPPKLTAARIAADQIAVLPSVYQGTQGTAIIKVFDLTAAATGNNEKVLRDKGIPYFF